MKNGLGPDGDKMAMLNLSTTGDHTAITATTVQLVFVAPRECVITDIRLAVTTAITAHASNHWTIQVVNQTGDLNLLSTAFNTDSDNSGNGGRALAADTATSLADNGAGNNYLQNAVLAAGDMLQITLTKAASAGDLTYPTLIITYRD